MLWSKYFISMVLMLIFLNIITGQPDRYRVLESDFRAKPDKATFDRMRECELEMVKEGFSAQEPLALSAASPQASYMKLLTGYIYRYSTSYKIVLEMQNNSNRYLYRPKLGFIFYRHHAMIRIDTGLIDYETDFWGMAPYQKGFLKLYCDTCKYDSLKYFAIYESSTSSDYKFCNQIFKLSNLSWSKGFILDYLNGTLKNQTNYSVKFAKLHVPFYNSENKMIDYDYCYLDERNNGNIGISRVTVSPSSEEQIEIKNFTSSSITIGGWKLGDKNDPNAYIIPAGTVIKAYSDTIFHHYQFGFSIDDEDEIIYLKKGTGTIVDTWCQSDVDRFQSNSSWGVRGMYFAPDSWDHCGYYIDYALYSIEGSGNLPPNSPLPTIYSLSCNTGEPIEMSFYLFDYNGHSVGCEVDWGDDSPRTLSLLIPSTSVSSRSHTYSNPGLYYIRSRAFDELLSPSGYSDRILVSVTQRVDVTEPVKPDQRVEAFIYPNPVNSMAMLKLDLPYSQHARLELFDILGRQHGVLFDGILESGRSDLRIDLSDKASGIYCCVVRTDRGTQTLKLLLLR